MPLATVNTWKGTEIKLRYELHGRIDSPEIAASPCERPADPDLLEMIPRAHFEVPPLYAGRGGKFRDC